MATNSFGLDTAYFSDKLGLVLRDLGHFTPEELARALARMARTACEGVLGEAEFTGRAAPEPAAWQDPESEDRICSARSMREAKRAGGATMSALKPLTRALYAAPASAAWISVECSLPREEGEVVVSGWAFNDPARGRYVTHAELSGGIFKPVDSADEYDTLHPPTHWMPLPAAPGDVDQPAAEQPDTVRVPRAQLEAWEAAADPRERPGFVRQLRALLDKEGEE